MASLISHITHTVAQEDDNPLWLIVLCDLMTNLMLFFLICYAFQLKSHDERAKLQASLRGEVAVSVKTEVPEEIALRLREAAAVEALRKALEEAGLGSLAKITVDAGQVRLSLEAPVLFRSGGGVLSAAARERLAPVARALSAIEGEVVVEGHTDSVRIGRGPWASNWELSVARAEAVARFLETQGILPGRLVVAGYGEFRPVADNATPEGRQANRRMEIAVTREKG